MNEPNLISRLHERKADLLIKLETLLVENKNTLDTEVNGQISLEILKIHERLTETKDFLAILTAID